MIIINVLHNSIFLFFTALAFFILFKNKKALINQMVFGFLAFLSIFSFTLALIQNPFLGIESANIFAEIGSIASIGYGIFMFLSICTFTEFIKPGKILFISFLIYFCTVIILQFKTDFVSITQKDTMGLWIIEYNNQLLLLIIGTIHNILVISGFIMLLIFIIKKSNIIKKKQSLIILITGLISFILATINVYLPQIFPKIQLPLLIDVFMMIFAIGLVYSIIKYELFEITPQLVINQIIDILPVGLIITNTDDQTIRINQSLLNITKRKMDDFQNVSMNTVLQNLTGQKNLIKDKRYLKKQIEIITEDNNSKPVLLFYEKIFDSQDRTVGSILLFQDIEELINTQKKLERLNQSLEKLVEERTHELFLAKEKAEESDRLKSAFMANMSHEIRTPMNSILGFTELLKLPDISGEEHQNFINIIEESGERMLTTLNNIMDISKIESGQIAVKISKMNLNKQLEGLIECFLQEAEKKNIKLFIKNKLPNEQVNMQSDKVKLNSILTNLISNAIKFTHSGSIELGYSVHKKNTHNELNFYIKDTGIGIPKDRQEAIFNRFEQADIEDQNAYEGSGLGLAITKAFVEMLGGKIRVESEENTGSRFCFTIPMSLE